VNGGARARAGYRRSVAEGIAVVSRDRVVGRLLVAYALTGGIGYALLLTLPRVVDARGLPPATVGLSFSALAATALVGARLARTRPGRTRRMAVLAGDPWLRAAVIFVIALHDGAGPIVVGFAVIGLSAGMANVARITLIQLRVPDELLGRVMSLYHLASQVLTPVTPFVWAAMADRSGITAAQLTVGVVFVVAGAVLVPTVRRGPHDPGATR
jgi:hypothetical protein